MLRSIALALVAALALPGCGPTCQSTCNRLYSSTGDNCNIVRAGETQSDLLNTCMDTCDNALTVSGEIDGYNPNDRQHGGQSASALLSNEKRAAVWMDCVADTSCSDLDDGYCAPVW
jgi:hypothetical protein